MKKKETKIKLEACFKRCALSRIQLRKCVMNAMNAGLTKDDILKFSKDIVPGGIDDESLLCAVTAIGQALRYDEKHPRRKIPKISNYKKEEVYEKLKICFKKCGLARRQLRKCVTNAIHAGLTKEEVLAITDDLVGGFGKNEVSVCAIIAVDQVLRYEQNLRKEPIDIVRERLFE